MVAGIGICVGLIGASAGGFAASAAAPTFGIRHVRAFWGVPVLACCAGLTALAAAGIPGQAGLAVAGAAGVLGVLTALLSARLVHTGDAANRAHDGRLHVRMWDVRSQVHRLQNKDHIEARLHRQAEVHGILDRYGHRFEAILVAIEHHLMLGDPERAERIITLFARHLRNLLFEGSVPFLALKTSLEHIRIHLRLMAELTDHRIHIAIEEHLSHPEDRERYTESLQLTPWAEAATWPLFEQAEQSTSYQPPARLTVRLVGRTLQCSCTGTGAEPVRPLDVRLLGEGRTAERWTQAVYSAGKPRAAHTERTTSAAVA